jgi:hypothetical protein
MFLYEYDAEVVICSVNVNSVSAQNVYYYVG